MDTAPATHPWILTAPWWHWPRTGSGGPHPRETAPALQKYATPDAVNEMLADPQRRLVFADTDLADPPRHGAGTGVPLSSDCRVRKLYLPSHHRHYLVACELHCDAPGLPAPRRELVCDAGFVIRRRTVDVPAEAAAEARARLRRLTLARAQLGALERKIARSQRTNGVARAHRDALAVRREGAAERVRGHEQDLRAWAAGAGTERELQGWFPLGVEPPSGDATPVPAVLPERPAATSGPRPLPGLGRWAPVDELPGELTEAVVPLYPLVAPPDRPEHDAAERLVWFGLVPTVSSELEIAPPTTVTGPVVDRAPRFDHLHVHEIRCFVRRHDPGCPRRVGERDCHGELVWSEPTEPFRLAEFQDPRGTAHRPVTIAMPDLGTLQEQAGTLVGAGGLRVSTPPGSQLDKPGKGGGGSATQICSFAIPLITIVAMFLLKLFLPIVVFLFQLWWLLALRICIPPSASVSAELAADIEARGPDVALGAGLEVKVEEVVTAGSATLTGAADALGGDAGDTAKAVGNAVAGLPAAERAPVIRALFGTAGLVSPSDDLRYAPRVERAEVLTS